MNCIRCNNEIKGDSHPIKSKSKYTYNGYKQSKSYTRTDMVYRMCSRCHALAELTLGRKV